MPWVRAPQRAIRLKVTLRGLRPPVWRRLLVEDTMPLGHLHMAVQAAMGWDNSHLHLFMVDRAAIGDPRQLDVDEDEDRVSVGALAARGVKAFDYVYDMGDSWEHRITIEGSGPLEPGRAYPACTGGKRACPPEDSGGVWGFAEMLEAVADPGDERHAELKEWLGAYDPEAFSAEARVRAWFAPRRTRRPRGTR
jgi:hypothetical protein